MNIVPYHFWGDFSNFPWYEELSPWDGAIPEVLLISSCLSWHSPYSLIRHKSFVLASFDAELLSGLFSVNSLKQLKSLSSSKFWHFSKMNFLRRSLPFKSTLSSVAVCFSVSKVKHHCNNIGRIVNFLKYFDRKTSALKWH